MIETIKNNLLQMLKENEDIQKKPHDCYSEMKYPKWIPLMRFYVDQYEIPSFGTLMTMHTKTKMGMELLTLSFMPGCGMDLPYLLIDAMEMKKKRCVFVEYYACGEEGLRDEKLQDVHSRFNGLPEYPEKPNWYIGEREPYSLIKSGTAEELLKMTEESLKAYLETIKEGELRPGYREKLSAFRERMIKEGNPSSRTLEMLLNKDGAVTFMKEVVMPVRTDI